jgi:hypothetical protein
MPQASWHQIDMGGVLTFQRLQCLHQHIEDLEILYGIITWVYRWYTDGYRDGYMVYVKIPGDHTLSSRGIETPITA